MTPLRRYRCLQQQSFRKEGYRIQPVSDADIEAIRVWRNEQMDVLRQMEEISPEDQIRYYEREIWPDMDHARPANILVLFCLNDNPIGYGGLVHIAWEHRRAEVSFLLNTVRTRDPDLYARDFKAFLGLMHTMAFDDLKLNRIYTETLAFREEHIRVLEEAGFRREGMLKEHMILGGKTVDSILHGYLNTHEPVQT